MGSVHSGDIQKDRLFMSKDNKYLNKYNKKLHSVRKLSKSDNGCCLPNTLDKTGNRHKRFMKQRRKYRFDERETWSMDYTSLIWLYEHIKMYVDIGGKTVDLEYPLSDDLKKELADKEGIDFNTQKEVLEYICKLIEKWDKCNYNIEDEHWEYAQQAVRLYAIILPIMWW